MTDARDRLVLWRWEEAENSEGWTGDMRSFGNQMRHVQPGNRLFICATQQNELFLLGALRVKSVRETTSPGHREQFGTHVADCSSLSLTEASPALKTNEHTAS